MLTTRLYLSLYSVETETLRVARPFKATHCLSGRNRCLTSLCYTPALPLRLSDCPAKTGWRWGLRSGTGASQLHGITAMGAYRGGVSCPSVGSTHFYFSTPPTTLGLGAMASCCTSFVLYHCISHSGPYFPPFSYMGLSFGGKEGIPIYSSRGCFTPHMINTVSLSSVACLFLRFLCSLVFQLF